MVGQGGRGGLVGLGAPGPWDLLDTRGHRELQGLWVPLVSRECQGLLGSRACREARALRGMWGCQGPGGRRGWEAR